MAKHLETLIFDYGGVICTVRRSHQFAMWAQKEFKVDPAKVKEVIESEKWKKYTMSEISAAEGYAEFQKLGICLPVKDMQKVYASFGAPDPNMKELLMKLKANGQDLAVLSDSMPELTEVVRKHFPNTFRVEIFSEEVGFKKPQPEIYELALKRINQPPNKCLFIDDQEKNLVYPRQIGMEVYQFDNVNNLKSVLKDIHACKVD